MSKHLVRPRRGRTAVLSTLLELLELDPIATDRFEAITPAEGPPRLFGGQVAAQSLRATTLTVGDDRTVHSMHSYFIRPGRPGVPLELQVERIRDGRSFATRRVTAVQGDEAIFVLDASFHVAEDGYDWAEPLAVDVPGPDELSPRELFGRRPPWAPKEKDGEAPRFRRPRAASLFELRPVNRTEDFSLHPAWVRLVEPIPDDPALHACALTYVSDMAVVRAAVAPGATPTWGGASLDHAVWFHRPLKVDEWLLFSAEPTTNHGARGLARGSFHTTDGTLVASFVQECLLRSTGMPPPP